LQAGLDSFVDFLKGNEKLCVVFVYNYRNIGLLSSFANSNTSNFSISVRVITERFLFFQNATQALTKLRSTAKIQFMRESRSEHGCPVRKRKPTVRIARSGPVALAIFVAAVIRKEAVNALFT
jgi:hypothetical protein